MRDLIESVEKADITPDPSLYPKLGRAGYNLPEALAELIDNSIDAREEGVDINIKIDRERGVISITDNGLGMDKEEAINSIILGKSNKEEGDLGQFGLGLKTACMSMGSKFIVETKKKNSGEKYIVEFDEVEFLKRKDWRDFPIKKIAGLNSNQGNGTRVTIENLKLKLYPRVADIVSKHLSERFSPFIDNHEVRISVNGKVVRPDKLDIVSGSREDINIDLSNGESVRGWAGLLEKGSIEKSGFNLYRYKRLIRAHEKLGYIYHPSKMWIAGELHMNALPVTHNKREFIETHPLYAEFFEKWQKVIAPLLSKAQKRHREESMIQDLPKEVKETLKDNILRALNKTRDLEELALPGQGSKKRSDNGFESDQEARREKEIATIETTDGPLESDKGRDPKKIKPNKVRFINIAGHRFQFDFDWQELEEDVPKHAYLDKDQGLIMVLLNSRYSILDTVKPNLFYYLVYVIEGIIEVFLRENNQPMDRVIELRDSTVQSLAKVMSDDTEEQSINLNKQKLEVQSELIKGGDSEYIRRLSEREKLTLEMLLKKGITVKVVAQKLGISKQRVYQILGQSLKKLEPSTLPATHTPTSYRGSEDQGVVAIITRVTRQYGLTKREILGQSRQGRLITPRHMIAYLLRKELGISFPNIAKILNRRDHTTAIYACNKIDNLIKEGRVSV
ncbi:MAG: ATP-binding protein [Candidatus Colwellbacteria bacterium]|nr:ATP-binding protein [Candidatus Colwellbacteria bacterium]